LCEYIYSAVDVVFCISDEDENNAPEFSGASDNDTSSDRDPDADDDDDDEDDEMDNMFFELSDLSNF